MATSYRRIYTGDRNLEAIQDSMVDEFHRLSAPSPWMKPTDRKTGDYTAVAGEMVVCDPTDGAFAITLPTSNPGDHVIVKNVAASSNTITIRAAGGGLIDSGAAVLITTGGGWWMLVATRPKNEWAAF
jgi:hypothetical protein